MDQDNNDPNNVAYMALLNRNIPGVGTTALNKATDQTRAAQKPQSHSVAQQGVSTSLTEKQRHAIQTLEKALENAPYVSEGEEPYETVHIVPPSKLQDAVALHTETDTKVDPTLPSATQLLQALKELSMIEDTDDGENDLDHDDAVCEQTFDLATILASSNPGHKEIATALHTIFGYDPSQSTRNSSNS
ncbi:hypothetical protein BGZ94_004988, partial [Podila epigama]